MADLGSDLQTILALIYLVWIYGWAKNQLGSAKLAILFAVIVVYLVFFTHPDLIWLPVILFLVAFFGKNVIEKLPHSGSGKDFIRD
jgi:O-antigen ligase